jgi:hypothetical protein
LNLIRVEILRRAKIGEMAGILHGEGNFLGMGGGGKGREDGRERDIL